MLKHVGAVICFQTNSDKFPAVYDTDLPWFSKAAMLVVAITPAYEVM